MSDDRILEAVKNFTRAYMGDGRVRQPGAFDEEIMGRPSTTDIMMMRLPAWNASVFCKALGELELSGGSVYPALRALEKDGLVEPAGEEPCGDRGGRPRQLYRITERGREEAAKQREVMVGLMAMADGRRGRCGTAVEAIPQAELGREAEVTVEQRWVVRDEEGP